MKNKPIGWKLSVHQSNFSTRDYVSKLFHYFDKNEISLCKKFMTDKYFETDLKTMRWNIKNAYEKGVLCKRCLNKLLKEKTLDEILGEEE